MSNSEGSEKGRERDGFKALDKAVGRTLEELNVFRQRALDAGGRSAELEALLMSFESGEETLGSMKQRLARMEEENRDLRLRVAHGRETVERMLARIDFVEVQK